MAKKLFFALYITILPVLCFSQNLEIKYNVYSKIRKSQIDKLINNKNNQEYKGILSNVQAEKEDSFLLVIQGKQSSYEQIEPEKELSDDAGPKIVIVSSAYSEEGHAVYKDLVLRKMSEVRNFLAKSYRLDDSLPQYTWKMEPTTREIMGLKCYKALIGDSVVAWFCPEIPVNEGPDVYCGLPGLILDLEDNDNVYYCVSINTNSKKNVSEPKKCKNVTEKEFENLKKRVFE